jgi:hypothetical protein
VASLTTSSGASRLASVALVALKCAVSAWALHVGFTHVSDDDYARVTIAQAFVHAPHVDPSGTSWLPFPFWLNGVVMMALGRSLAVARGVAIASAVVGAIVVHRTLLRVGVRPWAAFVGVAVAMGTPWSTWLGVATVPEALCAALIATGALCLAGVRSPRSIAWPLNRWIGGVALAIACLSRYEAWPVAAVFAVGCAVSAFAARDEAPDGDNRERWLDLLAGALSCAGPIAWLCWNAHVHDDAMHFLARVAAYRVRVTNVTTPVSSTLYPETFVHAGPLTLALAACGAPGALFDRDLRRRWAWPLLAILALVVFLVEGDLHNGAPTHHPERALLAVFWMASMFGVDGARSLAVRFVWGHPKRETWMVGGVATLAVAWLLTWPSRIADYPARSEPEDRASQISRGTDLRLRSVPHVTVTPCAYEHFALIAAFEAPERVTVAPAPSSPEAGSGTCPRVDER